MVLTFIGEQANFKFPFTIKSDHKHPPPNISQSLIFRLVSRKTKHISWGIRYQCVKHNGPLYISFILIRMMKPSFIFVFYITAAKMPNKMKIINENNLTILFSSLMYSSILSIIIWSSSFTTILMSPMQNNQLVSYVSYPTQSTSLTFHYPGVSSF